MPRRRRAGSILGDRSQVMKAPANLAEPASEEELITLRQALMEFVLAHHDEAMASLKPADRENNTHLDWFESIVQSLLEEEKKANEGEKEKT